jgi:hypothetical protein
LAVEPAAALASKAVLKRTIVASTSAEQGPARVADVKVANATALNANILAIFMVPYL